MRRFLAGNPVEQILVEGGVLPVDAERTDPGGPFGLMAAVACRFDNPRGEQRELHEVARRERQLDDFLVFDQAADLRIAGLQERGRARDLDFLGHVAEFERDVNLE